MSSVPDIQKVYLALWKKPRSVYSLATQFGIPEASVRRIVGELRREGWSIITKTTKSRYRVYELGR